MRPSSVTSRSDAATRASAASASAARIQQRGNRRTGGVRLASACHTRHIIRSHHGDAPALLQRIPVDAREGLVEGFLQVAGLEQRVEIRAEDRAPLLLPALGLAL